MQVNGLIVAAGKGNRMGGGEPKAFLLLNGRPMLLHTLSRFSGSRFVKRVVIVTAPEEVEKCQQLIESDLSLRGLNCRVCAGGVRRQDSVALGLAHLDKDCDVVVIHDGARPFVSAGLIDRCVEEALQGNCVVTGVQVQDTIKVVSDDRRIRETPPRENLWSIQTPQVFPLKIIREAHLQGKRSGIEATDDAMLVEKLGIVVTVLEGDRSNIKVTYPHDLVFAEMLLSSGKLPS